MRKIIVPILLCSLNTSYAGNKTYYANLDNSLWYVSTSTPIQCTLEHPIPRYGQANFDARASKKINLNFILKSKLPMPKTTMATLISIPPQWQPGSPATPISQVKFHQQFNGYATQQKAWLMLSELEQGQYPTFYFKDWYNGNQVTSVGLSSVNFLKSYDEFNNCIANLLPYNFDDISYSILKYAKNGIELDTFSKKRLKMIGDYIKYDENISVILVAGYSDSYGTKSHNMTLSKKRAESIKSYLKEVGLEADKIQVSSFGEKRHIADNRNVLGRMQNRRVVISIQREEI